MHVNDENNLHAVYKNNKMDGKKIYVNMIKRRCTGQ